MDTVLLDPPLVALDKDAPVPYAGRKNKCTYLLYSICTLAYPHTFRKLNTHTVYTSSHTYIHIGADTRMLHCGVQATVATSHHKTKTDDPTVLCTHSLSWRLNSIYHP